MKKGSISKVGKRILILMAVILVTFAIASCSRRDRTEKTFIESMDDLEQAEENPQDETEHMQAAENGAEALLQYREQLKTCDLSGTQLIYETVETDGYCYFMTQGLKGLPEKREGCLDAVILDLDEDGEEELLTFNLQEGSEAYQIQAKVYEYRDGQVAEAAEWNFLNDAIGVQCDGGEIRFMIKDDKYICMDSWQSTFISADGVSIELAACYYDGTKLVKAAEFGFLGSDYYEMGKEETELVEQMRSMGLDKTANGIYNRDVFHFCAADEGMKPLFKISLTNSNATGETAWDEMPTAIIRQINAKSMEEEFVLPESSRRVLTEDEILRMTKAQLRIARNEIYARYGWWFEDEELADYFEGKAWYTISENADDSILSKVERTNIALLTEMEQMEPIREDTMLESDMDIQGGVALTSMELGEISGFLHNMDAYGFLQSFYQDVRDVEVELVLYSGAGILDEEFSKSVESSYLKAVGKSEFDTDFIALRESDIDALFQRRTGYGLSDMRTPLPWVYLEEEKSYCMEAGDTNYMEVSVIDGMKTNDGMYYILYENPFLEYTSEETQCIVTLKKQGDAFQFVSNVRQ